MIHFIAVQDVCQIAMVSSTPPPPPQNSLPLPKHLVTTYDHTPKLTPLSRAAHAECGPYAATAGATCPLNVCCDNAGFCGTTSVSRVLLPHLVSEDQVRLLMIYRIVA